MVLLDGVSDTICLVTAVGAVLEVDGTDGDVPLLVAGTKIVFESVIVGGFLGKVKVTEDSLEGCVVVLWENILEMNGERLVGNLADDTDDILWEAILVMNGG